MDAKLLFLLLTTVLVGCVQGDISNSCLRCICTVEGCESQIGKCRMDAGSLSCGPYQIKRPYWVDCGSPGGDWQTCTKEMACSEQCVRKYTARYGARCSNPNPPTCETYARVHNGGPKGCKKEATIGYWNKVNACCGSDCDAVNLREHFLETLRGIKL